MPLLLLLLSQTNKPYELPYVAGLALSTIGGAMPPLGGIVTIGIMTRARDSR